MIFIQTIKAKRSKRTNVTQRMGGVTVGFNPGQSLIISQLGDTLAYTSQSIPKGFRVLKTVKVYNTQERPQAHVPDEWITDYLGELREAKVFYTNIGIFLKPYVEGEFDDYVR